MKLHRQVRVLSLPKSHRQKISYSKSISIHIYVSTLLKQVL